MNAKTFILTNIRQRQDAPTSDRGWVSYRPRDWAEDPLSYADRMKLSQTLKDLESSGLVECRRSRDGACRWIRLSPNGQAKAEALAREQGIRIPGDAPDADDLLRMHRRRVRRWATQAQEHQQRFEKQGRPAPGKDDWSNKRIRQEAEQVPVINDALAKLEAGTMTDEDGLALFQKLSGEPASLHHGRTPMTDEEADELWDGILHG